MKSQGNSSRRRGGSGSRRRKPAEKLSPKRTQEDLAWFGGTAAFRQPLHVGRPNVGDPERFLARARDILERRWFTNDGPAVKELEARITDRCRVRHCVLTTNATVALELLVHALELKGEVVVPSFTFVASAHALRWHGLKPVFCDVGAHTHTLDPARAEELITPRTAAILGVHLWGRPCEIEPLEALAARHGLRLFFDAAHAFGCSVGAHPIGGFGCAEVFSFHATKFFTTFEGGAITTHDSELARRLRLMRNFGFAGADRVVALGINAKMNEMSAAMGLTGLESLDEFIATNRRNHTLYTRALAGVPGLLVTPYPKANRSNYQYVVLEVDPEEAGFTRDQLMEILRAENVLARRYFYPGCHRMEPYATEDPGAGARLPVTERLAERVLALPSGTAVGEREIEMICSILRLASGAHHRGSLAA